MQIDLMRSPLLKSGYGQVGEGLYQAFKRLGVTVRDSVTGENADLRPQQRLFVHPPHTYGGGFEGQGARCLSMWGATRGPKGYTEMLGNFKSCALPNTYKPHPSRVPT